MKTRATVAALALTAVLACRSHIAEAFRPFDGTDAAVADPGDVEIELGPVEYLREAANRMLLAPDLRINYGFAPDWEVTVEGNLTHALGSDLPGTSLVGAMADLKTVLREGVLQDKPGASIGTEFSVLLPGTPDDHGTGIELDAIVSQRWGRVTTHLNLAAAFTRDQQFDYFLDTIIEGPYDWPVRPVCEFFYQQEVGQFAEGSGLIGAIWQVNDKVAVDFGLRGARINDHTAGEIRAGVTFAFGVPKWLGLPPRSAVAMRRGGT
jgi:hypothetical protein